MYSRKKMLLWRVAIAGVVALSGVVWLTAGVKPKAARGGVAHERAATEQKSAGPAPLQSEAQFNCCLSGEL